MQQIAIADNKRSNFLRVKKILEEGFKHIEIVEIPPYEKEIIDHVKKYDPSVLIMGVHGEGLNGLEVTAGIRKLNERVQVILVSELEYFTVLKEAMRIKVSRYFLENFQEEELLQAVEEALAYVERINAEKYSLERHKNILQEAMKYAEYSFIYTALFSASFETEYKSYKRILNLGDYGYILNIEIEKIGKEGQEEKGVYHYLKTIVSQHNACVVGPKIGERIVVFVNYGKKGEYVDEKRIEKRNTMDDVRMAAHIIIGMEKKFGFQVLIGIGGVKALTNIHLSYEEAVRCLTYRGKRNVVEIRDIEEEETEKEDYVELEEQFLKNIRMGDAGAIDFFTALLDTLRPLRLEIRRNKIFGLLVLADYEARSDSRSDLAYFSIEKMLEKAGNMNSGELERWAYNKVEYILNAARSNRMFRKSEGIKNAICYMEDNYQEHMTLEDIAKYIGISPQHFSKTFKEETGMTYIDWLTRLRIENAKRLMEEEKSTVKEVCYMVGYNDPNYFSRIFKKIEGVSPTEYMKVYSLNSNS